jgi:hypothetical protein
VSGGLIIVTLTAADLAMLEMAANRDVQYLDYDASEDEDQ